MLLISVYHCVFLQLKVDKLKLIELSGASESEFSSVRDENSFDVALATVVF